MGFVTQQHFELTPEARAALERHGWPDPIALALEVDIDVEALLELRDVVQAMRRQVKVLADTLPQGTPASWGGSSADTWLGCRRSFADYLRWYLSRLLLGYEVVVLLFDFVCELVALVYTVLCWVLSLLSLLGVLEILLHDRLSRAPFFVRAVVALTRLTGKGVNLAVTLAETVITVVAYLEPYLDRFLDTGRERLYQLRLATAGCLGVKDRLPDEPIPHLPLPPLMP